MNILCAASGQDGVPFAEGDPRLLGAGSSEKGLKAFANWAASTVIFLHCLVLDLLIVAYSISGYLFF